MSDGDGADQWHSAAIAPGQVGHRIVRFASLPSTMDEAARLAANGAPAGTVVIADAQTAGRGRAGRAWSAPAGSALLASIILRLRAPAGRWPLLALVCGVAVAETAEAAIGQPAWLKWPNDVWLGDANAGQKAAGILVTSRLGPAAAPAGRGPGGTVIVGIGLNVTTAAADLPPGATSLRQAYGRSLDREWVAALLWRRLEATIAGFEATAGSPDLTPWRRRAALIGEPVTVLDHDREHRGRLLGIDGDGWLLLRDAAGRVITVAAGDLARGPRRS